jgi:hypothetical protein
MAKLVKLTSKEGIVNKGNSFKCQCDEDIYIEPNSTVSLLNAHISSGILSTYDVDGSETKGQDTGLAVASLYLTADKSDRERRVVVRNGEYDITSITQELTNAANKSLIYNSAPTPISSTSDVYTSPSNSDFGLQMMVGLAAGTESSQVSIMFNSSQQIATNLTFSAKNDGVNIDPATGNISYTNPVGQVQVGLQTQLANQLTTTVTTTEDATTVGFAVGDGVTLVNTTNGSANDVLITAIGPATNNLATAVDVTFVSADTVKLDDPLIAPAGIPAEYAVDKIVTLDDRTSVTNPINNGIHGKIALATADYINNNISITEIAEFKGFYPTEFDTISRKGDGSTGVNLGIDLDIADAPDNGFEVGRYISIWTQKGGGNPHAVGTITKVNDNGDGTITINVDGTEQFNQGANLSIKDCQHVKIFDVVTTADNGGRDVQYIPTTDGAPLSGTGSFDGTYITSLNGNTPISQNTIQNIENIAGTPNKNKITFQPNQLTCLDAAGATLLTDLDAYFQFVSYYTTIADINAVSTIIVDKVQSDLPLTLADLTADEPDLVDINHDVVFDSQNGTITDDFTISSAPFQFKINDLASPDDVYCFIPVVNGAIGSIAGYIAVNDFFTSLRNSVNAFSIIADDANKQITLQLKDLDNPVTNTQVRLWLGLDIYTTSEVTLNIRGLLTPLNTYDLMIKGTVNKGANASFCVQDTRLSKSCGRSVFKVVTAGPCELGLISETPDFLSQSVGDNFVRVKIQNAVGAAGFVYTLWRGNTRVALKRDLAALDGDRVCIEWGVGPSADSFEYNNTVNGATNAGNIDPASYFQSVGEIVDNDRQKMLFSVCRNGQNNSYFYLGATADAGNAGKVIPWTPRNTPYIQPVYYDNSGNYRIYVCPNQAVVRLVEITRDPTLTTVDGVVSYITGDTVIYDETQHGQDHPDLTDNIHRLESFGSYWYWVWNDIYFQKQLGYKAPSQYINAAKGSFNATTDYLTAYLPENLVIFLDNIPSESYDLEKVKGGRRNIIGTCINTQGKKGEINVEPANLYKIALNNKQSINLRKFIVSFETFYGEQVQLMSARAVVNLLFEPPK